MKAIINGRIILPEGEVSGKALLFDEKIVGIVPENEVCEKCCEVIDAKGNAAPLDLKARYIVALSDYISGGGDGFSMLGEGKVVPSADSLVADVLDGYIRSHTPVKAPEGGRIVRVK